VVKRHLFASFHHRQRLQCTVQFCRPRKIKSTPFRWTFLKLSRLAHHLSYLSCTFFLTKWYKTFARNSSSQEYLTHKTVPDHVFFFCPAMNFPQDCGRVHGSIQSHRVPSCGACIRQIVVAAGPSSNLSKLR
jgi:hypothetical protein